MGELPLPPSSGLPLAPNPKPRARARTTTACLASLPKRQRSFEGALIDDRYSVISLIGSGPFASVFHAVDLKSQTDVALKIFRKPSSENLPHEVAIHRHLADAPPTIVQFHRAFTFDSNVCIVFELFGGDLLKFTRSCRPSIPDIKAIALDILNGLAFCHSKRVVHCDVKPENILVSVDPEIHAKLADLGTSSFAGSRRFDYFQSRWYRAPEVILRAKFGSEVDIWGFACVLGEMAAGKVMMPGADEHEQLALIVDMIGPPPDGMVTRHERLRKYAWTKGRPRLTEFVQDEELADLLGKCLNWEPENRVTAERVMRHPWLRHQ